MKNGMALILIGYNQEEKMTKEKNYEEILKRTFKTFVSST